MLRTPVQKSFNDDKYKMPVCPPPPRQFTSTLFDFSASRGDKKLTYQSDACLETDILMVNMSPRKIPLLQWKQETLSIDVDMKSDDRVKEFPSLVSPSPNQRRLLFAEDTDDELGEDFNNDNLLKGFFLSPPSPVNGDFLSQNNSFVIKKLKPRPSNLYRPYPSPSSSTMDKRSRSILRSTGMEVLSLNPRVPSYRPSSTSRKCLVNKKTSATEDLAALSLEPSSLEKQTDLEQKNSFNLKREQDAKRQCMTIDPTRRRSFPRAA